MCTGNNQESETSLHTHIFFFWFVVVVVYVAVYVAAGKRGNKLWHNSIYLFKYHDMNMYENNVL